jgi:hypothetical protein
MLSHVNISITRSSPNAFRVAWKDSNPISGESSFRELDISEDTIFKDFLALSEIQLELNRKGPRANARCFSCLSKDTMLFCGRGRRNKLA